MTPVVAWTEFGGIAAPDGVELLAPGALDDPAQRARITFFVPRYMGGREALEPASSMPNLSVLQVPNAGYDDALAFLRPGITLCNARGVHDESTAELAVALALAGRRGFADFAAAQHEGRWSPARRGSLTDSRIAVIGHGSIGRTIARMLAGFTVEVTAFSRRGTDGATPVSELPVSIGSFDVVILIVPLTDATEHLFDAAMMGRMRDGALLVNISRGRVVDTDALVAELRTGRISAALDVTDPEPLPPEHPLWSAPNCLITPHVGGNTTAFEPRMRALIEGQLGRVARGEPLVNIVAGPSRP